MKVEFMPGIAAITGSMKSRNGKRVVFTHRQGDKPGQGRMYFRSADDYVRSTPPSEKELAAQLLFRKRAKRVKQLMAENPKLSKAEAWAIVKAEKNLI